MTMAFVWAILAANETRLMLLRHHYHGRGRSRAQGQDQQGEYRESKCLPTHACLLNTPAALFREWIIRNGLTCAASNDKLDKVFFQESSSRTDWQHDQTFGGRWGPSSNPGIFLPGEEDQIRQTAIPDSVARAEIAHHLRSGRTWSLGPLFPTIHRRNYGGTRCADGAACHASSSFGCISSPRRSISRGWR